MNKVSMNIIYCFIFFIGFHSLSFANPQVISEVNNNKMAPVTVPLELNGKMKGMPIVNVKIGAKVLRLALDTGANKVFLAINSSVLKELNVKYSAVIEKNLDTSGTLHKSRTFEIPEVTIGDIQFNSVTATEELRDCPDDSDGIIGNRLFDSFNVLIDYSQSKMILYPHSLPPSDLELSQWTKISFRREDIGIVIQGRLGNLRENLRFCLDSGAVAENEEGKPLGLLRLSTLVARDKAEDKKTYTDNLIIDDKDIGAMDFYILDFNQPPVDGFLGYNLFSKYKVFIDFTKQVMYIKAKDF